MLENGGSQNLQDSGGIVGHSDISCETFLNVVQVSASAAEGRDRRKGRHTGCLGLLATVVARS